MLSTYEGPMFVRCPSPCRFRAPPPRGAAGARLRAFRLRQRGRQHVLGVCRSRQIRSLRMQAARAGAQEPRRARRRTAGADGEGRDRRRRAPWWRRSPIATNTSPSAPSRSWPRRRGSATNARKRLRRPPRRHRLPRRRRPPRARVRRGPAALCARDAHRSREVVRPPVVDPVLPRQHAVWAHRLDREVARESRWSGEVIDAPLSARERAAPATRAARRSRP